MVRSDRCKSLSLCRSFYGHSILFLLSLPSKYCAILYFVSFPPLLATYFIYLFQASHCPELELSIWLFCLIKSKPRHTWKTEIHIIINSKIIQGRDLNYLMLKLSQTKLSTWRVQCPLGNKKCAANLQQLTDEAIADNTWNVWITSNWIKTCRKESEFYIFSSICQWENNYRTKENGRHKDNRSLINFHLRQITFCDAYEMKFKKF